MLIYFDKNVLWIVLVSIQERICQLKQALLFQIFGWWKIHHTLVIYAALLIEINDVHVVENKRNFFKFIVRYLTNQINKV